MKTVAPPRRSNAADDEPETWWTLQRIVEVSLAIGALTAVVTVLVS
jgi:hypothetical protein